MSEIEINEGNCALDVGDLFNIEQAFEVFSYHNGDKELMDELYRKIAELNDLAKERKNEIKN